MHGVQRPISLEYQIYPPAIDTIVTGMAPTSAPPGLLWPALQPAFSPSVRLTAEIELSKDPYRTFLWLGEGLRLVWPYRLLDKSIREAV